MFKRIARLALPGSFAVATTAATLVAAGLVTVHPLPGWRIARTSEWLLTAGLALWACVVFDCVRLQWRVRRGLERPRLSDRLTIRLVVPALFLVTFVTFDRCPHAMYFGIQPFMFVVGDRCGNERHYVSAPRYLLERSEIGGYQRR